MDQGSIAWNPEKLRRLKREYNKHKDDKDKIFKFDGYDFLVGYAKYLIEYLEGRFKNVR
jgi:hypothetical protein